MANTTERVLRLLSLLQRHRHWSGDELRDRLGVSDRTLRRDVERLRELGYPVDSAPGVAGGYQLRAGSALPPLLLDDEEAVAIAVGLRSAAAGSVAGVEDIAVQALAKVMGVLPPRLRRRVSALQEYTVPAPPGRGPIVDARALTVLAQACRDAERVRFAYTRRDGASADRHVEPLRLVSVGQRWYLVGYDLDRADWRSFRVDRLSAVTSTQMPFRPRPLPAADAASFVQQGLSAPSTRHAVEVLVHAPAAKVQQVVQQWGEARARDDSSCVLHMSVDDLYWPVLVLAAVGAPFEVLGPDELYDYVRQVATLFVGAVGPPATRSQRPRPPASR